MKIIATNGECLILDKGKVWICYSWFRRKEILTIDKKKDNPNWYLACISKWGYIPIKPVIEIKDTKEITEEVFQKALNSQEWEKDYVS